MDTHPWLSGRIVTFKGDFGFIRPNAALPEGFKPKDVHFHQRRVIGPEMEVNLDVDFQLDNRSQERPSAFRIKRAGYEINSGANGRSGQNDEGQASNSKRSPSSQRSHSKARQRSQSRTRQSPNGFTSSKGQPKEALTQKNTRQLPKKETGRQFRLFHEGRICMLNIDRNFGYMKPTYELPSDYPSDQDVQFQVNKVHNAGMVLKQGDRLQFTLGTQDKSKPKGFNLKVVECMERTDSEVNEFLNMALEILQKKSCQLEEEPMDIDENESGSGSKGSSQYLVDLLTCPAVWQGIGRCRHLSKQSTRKCLHLLREINQAKTLRHNVASTLEAFIKTPLMDHPDGTLIAFLNSAIRHHRLDDIQLIQDLFLLVFKLLPEKSHAMVPLMKPMVAHDWCKSSLFLFSALREVTKRLNDDINDMEWDELPLVPSVGELTGGPLESTVNLRPVKVKGSYASSHEYMDINFRLLRADSFDSLRKGIRSYLEGRLDHRDMNIYQSIKLVGMQTTQSEGGLVILLRVVPFRKVSDWSRSSCLMFGNLLCISPLGNFKDPVWVTVVNRDVKLLKEKSTIMVGLCTECNPMSDADAVVMLSQLGQNAVMAESPTYYRAYQPVLKTLQAMDPESLPFTDALVKSKLPGNPEYIHSSSMVSNPTFIFDSPCGDLNFSSFVNTLATRSACLDRFQKKALLTGLFYKLSIIQGPPGTGKTYIGTKLLQTIIATSTRPSGPILTLTYKNHALDEFLKPMLSAYPNDVVRVGGRSQDSELESCNLTEILRASKKTKDLQDRIRDKYAELDAIRPKVTESVKRLDRSQKFTLQTLLEFANENQILNLLVKCDWDAIKMRTIHIEKKRVLTQQFVYECVSQIDSQRLVSLFQNPDSANGQYKLLTHLLNDAFMAWQPTNDEIQQLEKRMSHIQISLLQQEPMDTDEENSDLDREDLEEKEQERMASSTQVKTNSADVIPFAEPGKGNTRLLCFAQQSMSQFPVAQLMMAENLWQMTGEQRAVFVQALLMKQAEEPRQEFEQNLKQYQQLCVEKNELDEQHKADVLASKKVIGMTITGASIHHDLLSRVKPAVVLVEEAAEVLEPQILAVLGPWVKHLILIGDHRQLKPPVESFELCRNFHFDISLMERLINNGFEHSTLGFQNRMRKEFAELLLDIYPDLRSNEKRIASNEKPKCIEKSMFFWSHDDPEKAERSCSNDLEADRVVKLALFLIQQGYQKEQITLLCAYQGQVSMVRKKLRSAEERYPELFPDVGGANSERPNRIKVHTIDLYQGDENDIVIVSLVRSHSGSLKGFLRTLNRRCVAQSRAKCGMYFVGNADLLSTNKYWKTLISKMKEQDCVDKTMTLCCPKHPYTTLKVTTAGDISLGTFCFEPCKEVMVCRQHMCTNSCQPPHNHSYCKRQVLYKFTDCPHSVVKDCSKEVATLRCRKPCERKMACNMHACTKKCGEDHSHRYCVEYVDFNFPTCGHRGEKRCSDPIEGLLCKEKIRFRIVSCGHIGEKECFQHADKIRCKEKCTRKLSCGHPCSMKCGEPCVDSKCEDCERIRKVEAERKRKMEQQEREEARKRVRQEIEELKKKPLDDHAIRTEVLSKGDTAAEYYKVEDMVQKYVQPTHKWFPRVTKIEKIDNMKLRMKWLEKKEQLFDPQSEGGLKFHGTSADVVDKIIEEGFKMPKNPGMYGRGIYFATDSSKSAQDIYTKGSNMLLLCDVLLGRTKTVETAAPQTTGTHLRITGYDSLYAKRGTKDTKGVLYDEFVVYDPAQALPRYIIHYEKINPDHNLNLLQLTQSLGNQMKMDTLKPKRQMDHTDPLDIHFRIAESQFLRLGMSKKITSVELYTNPTLMKKFGAMKDSMQKKYPGQAEGDPILAFHGTKITNIQNIVKNNFDITRLSQNTGDQGYYGAGIYFSEFPATSIGYAAGCTSLLLCEVLPGKSYVCTGLMMGASLKPGYDSHIASPDKEGRGQELVIYNPDQILPRYVINFQ